MQIKNTDNSDDEDEDDDLFSTPISTPPNELETSQMEYFNYELNLNNLQLLNGTYNLDNECLTNTKNTKYIFDKFNIKFNINILKNELIKQHDANAGMDKPLINVNINCNLLKINIDFNKLISLNKILRSFSIKNKFRPKGNSGMRISTKRQCKPTEEQTRANDQGYAYLCINTCLDELDVQIYGATNTIQDTVYSIAEFKLNRIKCELMKYDNMNMNIKFSIFSLLLIDALQIYGQDYQLLASSHQYASLIPELNKVSSAFRSLLWASYCQKHMMPIRVWKKAKKEHFEFEFECDHEFRYSNLKLLFFSSLILCYQTIKQQTPFLIPISTKKSLSF